MSRWKGQVCESEEWIFLKRNREEFRTWQGSRKFDAGVVLCGSKLARTVLLKV